MNYFASPSEPTDLYAASDELLASRAQGGCAESFAELAERMQPRLMFVLRRRLQNYADAEDVAQKTLLRAFEKIQLYDPAQKFSPWLFTIALRLAVDHHRKRQLPTAPGEAASVVVDSQPQPDELASHREDARGIWKLAEQVLKPEQWTALWLLYGEGQTIKDIAKTLNRTCVSVRVLLFRARKALTPHLSQFSEAIETNSEERIASPTPLVARAES